MSSVSAIGYVSDDVFSSHVRTHGFSKAVRVRDLPRTKCATSLLLLVSLVERTSAVVEWKFKFSEDTG